MSARLNRMTVGQSHVSYHLYVPELYKLFVLLLWQRDAKVGAFLRKSIVLQNHWT